MALSKNVPTQFGVDATYHRIVNVNVDYQNKVAAVVIAAYVSAEARLAGKQPLGMAQAQISGAEFAFTGEPTRTEIYAKIKAKAEWADAVDA